jgi:hypothetical protein
MMSFHRSLPREDYETGVSERDSEQALLATFIMLVSCLAFSSALKMGATCLSEISFDH